MTILPLVGYKSYKALVAFHTLMFGLKMLPDYITEQYEDFFARIDSLTPDEQRRFIEKAVLFVELDQEVVESLVCFAVDPNGVPYGPRNLKRLGPSEITKIICEVCFAISQIKTDFLSKAEKKN